MSELVIVEQVGSAGIIRLNRPKAINALNSEMIHAVGDALTRFSEADDVNLVILEGEGEKGFCAGGDVRAVRQLLLDGDREAAHAYFADEYRVDKQIATYDKPVVALMHGVTMGGGLGLAGHATFRFAREGSRFAMPEAAIGFFPDVGVRALLRHVPRELALFHMLRGDAVNVADAIALNFADCMVAAKDWDSLRAALITVADELRLVRALQQVRGRFAADPGEGELVAFSETHKHLLDAKSFAETPFVTMPESVRADLGYAGDLILSRCEMTHHVSFAAMDAALADEIDDPASRDRIFESDLRLAHFMADRPDFVEGVRALLVDKDNQPNWTRSDLPQNSPEVAELLTSLVAGNN